MDECQDLNNAQHALLKRFADAGSRIFAVGDRFQAIYGFRGALSDSIDRLRAMLEETPRGVKVFPLSISWRLPKSGARRINRMFPHIPFSVPDSAPEGSDSETSYEDFLKSINVSDSPLVLCAQNAPLVGAAFSLLKEGKRCQILGKEFAQTLLSFVAKFKARTIASLLTKVEKYRKDETARIQGIAKGSGKDVNQTKLDAIDDKCDCVVAIAEDCKTVDDFRARVTAIFADSDDASRKHVITLSSVHKAKGMESASVYILNADLLNPRKNMQQWEKEQMDNLRFVAYSRHKFNLYVVADRVRKDSPKVETPAPEAQPAPESTETPKRKRSGRKAG
jgi:DNA helicase II / ATP-dependent DNA helicase PcrA